MTLKGDHSAAVAVDGSLFSNTPSTELESVFVESPSTMKRQSGTFIRQSKRPMYCRNAYMHYLVRKMISYNPYVSLQEILRVLEEKHVDCKEVTVAKVRLDERSLFITSMKDIIPVFSEMRTD